jgi:hypothetical protein
MNDLNRQSVLSQTRCIVPNSNQTNKGFPRNSNNIKENSLYGSVQTDCLSAINRKFTTKGFSEKVRKLITTSCHAFKFNNLKKTEPFRHKGKTIKHVIFLTVNEPHSKASA